MRLKVSLLYPFMSRIFPSKWEKDKKFKPPLKIERRNYLL
jgi:hypothetical protein